VRDNNILKTKQKRRERIAAGERLAATRAAAGRQLIAAPVSLRKGGQSRSKTFSKQRKRWGTKMSEMFLI
jgi:hypothetical protein